ncbi:cytochrome P450 [Actinomadura viridis]|uniref:Nocardicin N-oxygenase n=1 Tax=Actinomadura viridis TaxID=58110 RepID=A0A931GSG2_9ACTN|nr:cytochrome P450 [Actinomadura viridis]MBG6090784.1 nocardicin N-oxygenase [Actinomadura viridis]
MRLSPLILAQDGEHHRNLRSLVSKSFTRPRIEKFRPNVEALVSRHMETLESSGGPADLVNDLAWPVSLHAIAELLGAPEDEVEQFWVWGDMLLSTGPDRDAQNAAAMVEIAKYAGQLMQAGHNRPSSDIISTAVTNAQNLGIDPEEVALFLASLIIAGWETTAAAITATVYKLLTVHGEEGTHLYRRLCEQPELIPSAVEELLRVVPNSWFDSGQPRRAARDVMLAGAHVKKGDVVLVAHDVASRDPEVFDAADEIKLDRAPNPHLAFGFGAHFCLGAHLARLEINVVLEFLTGRFPDLRLAVPSDQVRWNTGTPIRRIEELPVAWGPSPGSLPHS